METTVEWINRVQAGPVINGAIQGQDDADECIAANVQSNENRIIIEIIPQNLMCMEARRDVPDMLRQIADAVESREI